jgi:DNA polymerase-1
VATILLLDGNSLAYRAFFALPTDMATASGQVTNAVFGFTSMLVNLLKDHKPDSIAVAFDRPEPTFRHEQVEGYKAGRAEAPDILRQQMGLVRQVVETLKIPLLELAGFEADDILATLATQARDRGDDVIIVTGDRDAYQLVEDPHVKVLYNRRGVSDYVLYDEAGIKERTGVTPAEYPEYAAMRGDPSDNLPGVPGVGEKTAAKLINDYGNLDGIFANLDKLTPKLRQNMAEHERQVRINAAATPLVRDVPIECDVDDLKMGGWDRDEVKKLFTFLEFRTLWDRLIEAIGEGGPGTSDAVGEALDVDLRRLTSAVDAVAFVDKVTETAEPVELAGAFSGQPGRSPLVGVALAYDHDAVAWIDAGLLGNPDVASALGRMLALGGVPASAHDAKQLMRGLMAFDIEFRNLSIDTSIAAYLIDPGESGYLLEDLAMRYAGVEVRSPDAAPAGQLDLAGGAVDEAEAAARQAAAVRRLLPPMETALQARNLWDLYDTIERPLVHVLARMETVGVRVDVAYLRSLVDELTAEARALEVEIQEIAGHPFTVNSTKQLRTVLFDELGLQPQKKTKTGFSTDASSLEKIRDLHPIIDKLLRYREV